MMPPTEPSLPPCLPYLYDDAPPRPQPARLPACGQLESVKGQAQRTRTLLPQSIQEGGRVEQILEVQRACRWGGRYGGQAGVVQMRGLGASAGVGGLTLQQGAWLVVYWLMRI